MNYVVIFVDGSFRQVKCNSGARLRNNGLVLLNGSFRIEKKPWSTKGRVAQIRQNRISINLGLLLSSNCLLDLVDKVVGEFSYN